MATSTIWEMGGTRHKDIAFENYSCSVVQIYAVTIAHTFYASRLVKHLRDLA